MTIRCASPSTIAVLPVPGSPMRTGLFLVRRDSTCMTLRISSSRPMTGSSLPFLASAVRSRLNFSSAWYLSSGFWSVTRWPPRMSASASSMSSLLMPISPRMRGPAPPASRIAIRMCSVLTYSSVRPDAMSPADSRTPSSLFETNCLVSPCTFGSFWSSAVSRSSTASGRTTIFCRMEPMTPSG